MKRWSCWLASALFVVLSGCGDDGPGAARYIDIELSAPNTDAYIGAPIEAVTVAVTLTDERHRIVTELTPESQIGCTISEPNASVNLGMWPSAPIVQNVRVTGTFEVVCSLQNGVDVQIDRDSALLTVFDLTPPTPVIISNPIALDSFGAGQDIEVTIEAEDIVGLAQLQAKLEGPTDDFNEIFLGSLPQIATGVVRLSVPDNFNLFTTGTLYGLAQDTAGNVGVTAAGVTVNLSPVSFFDAGFTAALVTEAAQFIDPTALACNTVGAGAVEFWVADPGSNNIHYVAPDGTVSVFLSTPNPNGVALDAGGTNLYITRTDGQIVQVETANAANNVTLLMAPFGGGANAQHIVLGSDSPTVNAGEQLLYTPLEGGDQVNWVQMSTGVNGVFDTDGSQAAYDQPWGVEFRPSTTHLYVGSEAGDFIVSLTPDGADADTTADAGVTYANGGRLDNPRGLALVPEGAGLTHEGDLMIANFGDRFILRGEDADNDGVADGGMINFARMGPGTPPTDLAFCDGSLFVLTRPDGDPLNPIGGRIIQVTGF